jgi:hypothetical protein
MKVYHLVCWNYETIYKMFGTQFLLRSIDDSMKIYLGELQLFLPPKGGGLATKCELHNVCTILSE